MSSFRPSEKDVVYIGEGVSLTGSVQAQDTVVVDGNIEGEVSCAQLIVGPTGVVDGAVSVSEADIYGKIGADIVVKQLLTVRASGRIEGKWTYGEIEVERGAVLAGAAESTEYRSGERKPGKENAAPARGFKNFELAPVKREGIGNVASLATRALQDRKRKS
ncbi:MAG TPA: polymer-forming cytoskeletal protein [Methylocystis sp.]|nr:polymer-forming cytoskeletal protein [Methylocystis sp.]